MYTWNEPYDHDMWRPYWEAHRITKITHEKIFVQPYDRYSPQVNFDRTEIEDNGYGFHKDGEASQRFYSEAGKAARDAEREEGDILGLCGYRCASSEIMTAFRAKAKIHHPDYGGDPQDFRRLCEAKDKALARATRRKQNLP
jgi:hypothetical protein